MEKAKKLTALERLSLYLSDENWVKAADDSYYCEQYPEFRLKVYSSHKIDQKVPENDRWMPEHWIVGQGEISVEEYRGYYFDTCIVMKDIIIWWCDNGHEPVPLPKIKTLGQSLELEDAEYTWELSKQSLNYKVAKVVARANGKHLEEILNNTKIKLVD